MGVDRQRTIPPEFFLDEDWMQMSDELLRTAIGLYFHVDDHGRQTTTEWNIKQSIYPHRSDVDEDLIAEHLLRLHELGVVGIYVHESRSYLCLRLWPVQSHPKPSRFPPPPEHLRKRSGSPLDGFQAGEGERGSEGEWASAEGPAGVPPSPFCIVHQPTGTRQNCRHCGTARLAHEQWIFEQQQQEEQQT